MNQAMVKGLLIGGAIATAAGAAAGYKAIENHGTYAKVVSVQPHTSTVRTPRQVCDDVVVTRQQPVRDPQRIAGTVMGAVVGGVVGHQIGDGDGRTVATVAGAAAGGYAGNRIQQRMQQSNTYQAHEQRCHTVYDSKQVRDGYDVRYTWRDHERTVRMDHDPGQRIPMNDDGSLALSGHKDTGGES